MRPRRSRTGTAGIRASWDGQWGIGGRLPAERIPAVTSASYASTSAFCAFCGMPSTLQLALALGLRQDEALGLGWHVDLDKGMQRQRWRRGCDDTRACARGRHRSDPLAGLHSACPAPRRKGCCNRQAARGESHGIPTLITLSDRRRGSWAATASRRRTPVPYHRAGMPRERGVKGAPLQFPGTAWTPGLEQLVP